MQARKNSEQNFPSRVFETVMSLKNLFTYRNAKPVEPKKKGDDQFLNFTAHLILHNVSSRTYVIAVLTHKNDTGAGVILVEPNTVL